MAKRGAGQVLGTPYTRIQEGRPDKQDDDEAVAPVGSKTGPKCGRDGQAGSTAGVVAFDMRLPLGPSPPCGREGRGCVLHGWEVPRYEEIDKSNAAV